MSVRSVTLVAFRKRFDEKDLAAILEASIPKAEAEKKDDSDDGNDPPNSGTLVLDATFCPVDIAYPQDIHLLNQAREKTEKTVDALCELTGQKKPRMYRTVYEQQRITFESGGHSIPRRIVSLAQPWVQPIVRGKAHANTEFGPKLHINLVDGYARIERLDFEPFNESEDLWRAVARYRERYGCYPERILADKIYRNRQTLAFCKEHGIRLSGPALGKPPVNADLKL